jgi:hypothetical protein
MRMEEVSLSQKIARIDSALKAGAIDNAYLPSKAFDPLAGNQRSWGPANRV